MPTPMRLAVFAKSNEPNIAADFAAITLTTDVQNFQNHLNTDLKCSVNLSQKGLNGCLNTQSYLSAYEIHGKNNAAALRNHFTPAKYPYRIAFDGLFESGDKIKYFTLNSGNLGMPNFWGRYCMVFELTYFDSDKCAIIRKNSLAVNSTAGTGYYYFDNNTPNINRIRNEISPITQAVMHCIIKKVASIAGTPYKQYPELVCFSGVTKGNSRTADYLELITTQDCNITGHYKVRMTEKELEYFFYASYDGFDDNKLGNNKRAVDREADEFVLLAEKYNFDLDIISL